MTKYDKTSVISIVEYANRLTGKTLADVVPDSVGLENKRNLGNLGTIVEKFYFEHDPPNDHNPDFSEAGLELKTTGIWQKSGQHRAKERLVLSMINFQTIIEEDWERSSLLHKCNLMLVIFYEYVKELSVTERKFVLQPMLCSFANQKANQSEKLIEYINQHALVISPQDMAVIKTDWELIRQKVMDGKAHELSEGDTFYLGACRKGSGGQNEPLKGQPKSDVKAKARAFSLKPGFVNKLIELHLDGLKYETKKPDLSISVRVEAQGIIPIGDLGVSPSLDFEAATQLRFKPFIGMSIDELAEEFQYFKKSKNHKGYKRELAVKILAKGGGTVSELQKAEIEMKTITLERSGRPREHMSFPAFKYMEIINQEWEESSFFERLERKFLFVVFQKDKQGVDRLAQSMYWNMPYEDREEARRVWEDTKHRVLTDARNLPNSKESAVAHVRPKAKDGQDREETPQGEMLVKKCFWLNSSYIAAVLAEKH